MNNLIKQIKQIKIQVFSDLHLELFASSFPKPKPLCPYLFLAGDIGRPTETNFQQFLHYCNSNWSKVYYVCGNHDLWNKTVAFDKIKDYLKEYIKVNSLTNIKFLDNGQIDLLNEDIYVIGSTFWTKGSKEAKNFLNDYNNIKIKDDEINITRFINETDITNISNKEYGTLEQLLVYSSVIASKYVIMLTHFPPYRSGTSHSKFNSEKGPIKEYFSWPNNTLNDFNTSNILVWISGHTHYSYDFISDSGLRLISNQMGYMKEMMNGSSNFNEDGIYTIDYIPMNV